MDKKVHSIGKSTRRPAEVVEEITNLLDDVKEISVTMLMKDGLCMTTNSDADFTELCFMQRTSQIALDQSMTRQMFGINPEE